MIFLPLVLCFLWGWLGPLLFREKIFGFLPLLLLWKIPAPWDWLSVAFFLLGWLVRQALRSVHLYYEKLWLTFQSQHYFWRHQSPGTSLMLALWAFYPYVLLLFLWFLYRWQALGRSWDLLPWLPWLQEWPLACWALLPPLLSLGLALARPGLELLRSWRGARLAWLETFHLYFLSWPAYRGLCGSLEKFSYFLNFHSSHQGEDYVYRRRYFFQLLLWPVSWNGPLRFLVPLLALGEILVRGGKLQTFFYVLPCLALALTLRKVLYYLLVHWESQDASRVYLYGGVYHPHSLGWAQHYLHLRECGLESRGPGEFPDIPERPEDFFWSTTPRRAPGNWGKWGFANHRPFYEREKGRRWYGTLRGPLSPAQRMLNWYLYRGKDYDPLVAYWVVMSTHPEAGSLLNLAWDWGAALKLNVGHILPWCKDLPVRISVSLAQAPALRVNEIQEVTQAHSLSGLVQGRGVLVATAQDLHREPLKGARAALSPAARCQRNPDYAVEDQGGCYAALLDQKTLQERELWKSTFVGVPQRRQWVESLVAYVKHYQPLGANSQEAREVALKMIDALGKKQDTRAVDLWLSALDKGLFLSIPPPPLRLLPEQSLDHFRPEFRSQLRQALGAKDQWMGAMSEEKIFPALEEWMKKACTS